MANAIGPRIAIRDGTRDSCYFQLRVGEEAASARRLFKVMTSKTTGMQRDNIIALLRDHEPELRRAGIGELYLFGSTARGEARSDSDVDVFFDLARPRGFTLFSLAALRERMRAILGSDVDLMTRAAIHPRRRPRIEAQAVLVF